MKEKFYIFLDIDGVLYDWEFLLRNSHKKGGIIKNFNPESINALNKLISEVSMRFVPELVVISTWRHDMDNTIKTLLDNGVIIDNISIGKTPIFSNPHNRSLEILKYVNNNLGNNYVIIDDENFDYAEHFSKSNIIKTNMFNDSLNVDMVDLFLKTNVIQDIDKGCTDENISNL